MLEVWLLTHDEELNLPACLESVKALPAKVVVIDSGSTDATVSLARGFGATVVVHPFETHSQQWNWALQTLPSTSEWILALDADQRLTPELAAEIQKVLRIPPAVDGYYLNRRQIFRARWIRHGGYYPKRMLKLFRRSRASCDETERVDSRFHVDGKCGFLENDMIEDNQKERDLNFWLSKHQRYAKCQAQEDWERHFQKVKGKGRGDFFGTPDQRVLRLKQIWNGLPLYLRPFLYFGWRYFFRFGFLDGKSGFVFHFLQAFWYRLLIDIHLDELKSGKR